MAQYLSQASRFVDQTIIALGFTSLGALALLVLLIIAVISAYIDRKEIEARLSDEENLLKGELTKITKGKEGMAQRDPRQSYGSAVIPATPSDPWRRGYSRMHSATNLREAASDVLDINADIKKTRAKAQMLGVIYDNEKAKARTAIMRKELGVFVLLALVGAIAAFGLK